MEPLPYHRRILEHLQREEPRAWQWFASEKFRAEHAEAARVELLKRSYRMEREAHGNVYALADGARDALGMAEPVTLYQAADVEGGVNAACIFVPGEIHVLLKGPLDERLTADEQRALLGHEIAHHLFCSAWEGELFAAEQAVNGMADDPDAYRVHGETARLFNLSTELFADRAALHVVTDPRVIASMLAKVGTGALDPDPDAFLRQADEAAARDASPTEELTHPEHVVRVRAVRLWAERGDDAAAEIARMIEGPLAIEALDLPRQLEALELTRRLVEQVVAPAWIRTEPVMAHARLFFDDASPAETDDPALYDAIREASPLTRDYFCYVLLDFAACDPGLEDRPLRAGLEAASRFGARERLLDIAARELGLGKRALQALRAP